MLRTLYYAGNLFLTQETLRNTGITMVATSAAEQPLTPPTAPAEQPAFKVSDAQKIELYIDEPLAELVCAFRAAAATGFVTSVSKITMHHPTGLQYQGLPFLRLPIFRSSKHLIFILFIP